MRCLGQEVGSDPSLFSAGETTGKTLSQCSPGVTKLLGSLEFSQPTCVASNHVHDL